MKGRKILLFILTAIIIGSTFVVKEKYIDRVLYPIKFQEYVEKYSSEYDLDKYLVYSIIRAESKFDPEAISHKDAKGLMQISDTTAEWAEREIGVDSGKIFDPEINIETGCWYLNRLFMEFGDKDLVVAAYNGGSGNVTKWLEDHKYSKDGKNLHNIPFKETLEYVEKVEKNYYKYISIYEEEESN